MKLLFTRKEYKYHVPFYLFRHSLEYFNNFLDCDPYNIDCRPYVVRSIYFDTLNYRHYNEKIVGAPYRKKVRVRGYGDKKSKTVFLEIKNKQIDKIFKERTPISSSFLFDMNFNNLNSKKDEKIYKECVFDKKTYHLRPSVLVYYKRIAFINEKIGFKVNMDFDIRAQKSTDLWARAKNMNSVLKNKFILEIKYTNYVPNYFLDFVQKHNLQRMPFSKYSVSVENS